MDFTNRGQQFQPNSEDNRIKQSESSSHHQKKSSRLPHRGKLLKIFQFALLVCISVLVAGILLSIATYKKNSEDRYVDSSKYQAVFLNGGQVYFGKIIELNKSSLVLSNIYYLRVNQQVQPGKENQQNNFTLAKLGCELHRPQDVMVVNKEQVIFWENLKDEDGENTVPGAIKKYIASTNGAQNCDQQQQPATSTNDNSSNTTNNTTGAGNTNDTSNTDNTTNDTAAGNDN